MTQFFQENIAALASMFVMAAFWFVLNLCSVKGNIKTIEKKMSDKGLESMTDDEKQIIKDVLRSSVINDAAGAFIGGIVAIIAGYFVLTIL